MDNLQPGDTISNKYGTRKVLWVLNKDNDGLIAILTDHSGAQWYTPQQLKHAGYELTLNYEREEDAQGLSLRDRLKHLTDNLLQPYHYDKLEKFISLERKDK